MSIEATKTGERLYRIMDFPRVVQIFEKESLYFAHPRTWDDPYEYRLKHQKSHAFFAQCWCQLAISDALWRIYSQNGMGVRISTTKAKLQAAVKGGGRPLRYRWRGGPVEYLTQDKLNIAHGEIATDLRDSFQLGRAVDALYIKREAFAHESEWRATLYCPGDSVNSQKKGVEVPVDPHALIDRILLDPRAPDELIEAFKFFFQRKLGFKGRVGRSALYKSPLLIDVNTDDEEL